MTTNLFIAIDEGLVFSETSTELMKKPRWYVGDTLKLVVTILERKTGEGRLSQAPYSKVDVTPLDLRSGIVNEAPADGENALLTSQATWTKDEVNDRFSASLSLGGAVIDAIFAREEGNAYDFVLIAEVIESTKPRTVLSTPVTLLRKLLPDP